MAIIQSTAIGKAKKTAGELTYRKVRGRTIASQRITENNSRTDPQILQRSAFAVTVKIAKSLSPLLATSFQKTEFGSHRNAFMKANKPFMSALSADIDTFFKDEEDGMASFLNFVNGDNKALAGIICGKGEITIGASAATSGHQAQSVSGTLSREARQTDLFHLWFAALLTAPNGVPLPYLGHLKVPANHAAVTLDGAQFAINVAQASPTGKWQAIPAGFTLQNDCWLINVTNTADRTATSNAMVMLDSEPAAKVIEIDGALISAGGISLTPVAGADETLAGAKCNISTNVGDKTATIAVEAGKYALSADSGSFANPLSLADGLTDITSDGNVVGKFNKLIQANFQDGI
jgi:hypothetical protein